MPIPVPRKLARLFCALALMIAPAVHARTWTDTGGRTVEGEFVSATATAVTVKLPNGKTVLIELAKLSQADRDFVAEQAKNPPAPPAAPAAKPAPGKNPATISGPYAEHITGDWKEVEAKTGLKYMFFAGKNLDASKKYPLVIYLHGKGNNVLPKGAQGFAYACSKPENYGKNPCFLLVPQCPDENGWQGNTGANFQKLLKDVLKNLPIDDNRIYLIGYSMGAFGTFAMLNEQPKMFAAAIPVAGGISEGAARNLRRIPIWIFHGEKDEVVKPDQSRAIAKALERLKAPVKYTEFPGEGHGIIGKVVNDPAVHTWLFEQKRK
ncbi:MAG TPA: prolyl oligopeptidase family serine peptidase [Verrucomicrobiales bacterium]|jgi:predicted peptidase|nr:prolyl oligopeptidase family serine peptidase [Verrucomicrobiales bacterium]